MERSKKQRILIVDDTTENIETLATLLKKEYMIIVAKNGEKAIQMTHKNKPDLILLDIMMSGIDGYEVCQRLKADPLTKMIPIIFITALSESMDEAKAFGIGAIDYITKPFIPEIVKARVSTQLVLKQYQDNLEDLVTARTQELEAAKILAEQANQAKSDFLMNMSHELKTPLNGVLTASELITSCDTRQEQQQIQEIIQASGHSLLKIVETILDFTKSNSGKLELHEKYFKLDQTLLQIKTQFYHKGRNIQLDLQIKTESDDIPNSYIGDAARIVEVLNHLLENAAKFSKSSHTKAILSIKWLEKSTSKGILQFSLQDNGIGIDPSHFKKIFKPFNQVESTITRNYDGVGIGLSICKKLIELMGGKIWVESELDRGSIFNFTIQLKLDKSTSENDFII